MPCWAAASWWMVRSSRDDRADRLAERLVALRLEWHDEWRTSALGERVEAELDVEKDHCRESCEAAHQVDLERAKRRGVVGITTPARGDAKTVAVIQSEATHDSTR